MMQRKIQFIIISMACLFFWTLASYAQVPKHDFCVDYQINGISWSPNGEQLAVITTQGAFIYGHDLELIRSVKAPVFADHLSRVTATPIWSPDSVWVVLPQRRSLDLGVAGNLWTILNALTGELTFISTPAHGLKELIWSPDNQRILTISYHDPLGLDSPIFSINLINGITENRVSPIQKSYPEIQLKNLQWVDSETFSLQSDNVTIYFDASTLEPKDKAPDISPNWWVSSSDGSREAAFMPDITLYVREVDGNEQYVGIDETKYSNDETFIGLVDEIYWLSDNKHLIGIYERVPAPFSDEYPDFSMILQGTVVDATTATEINNFFIQTENDIKGYSVSSRGDRIAVHHSPKILDVWNPMTGEHLKTIEVPALPLEELCNS